MRYDLLTGTIYVLNRALLTGTLTWWRFAARSTVVALVTLLLAGIYLTLCDRSFRKLIQRFVPIAGRQK